MFSKMGILKLAHAQINTLNLVARRGVEPLLQE